MTEQKIILTCVIIMLLVVLLAIVACMLVVEIEKNKDLQLENSDLIAKVLKLQSQVKKKRELLEVQDKIIADYSK